MSITESPQVRARTKIVVTVGPASRDPAMLADLAARGADVFRINTAHGSREEHAAVLRDLQQLGSPPRRPLAVLVDLAGPKIRLGPLADDPLKCAEGQQFELVHQTACPTPQVGRLTCSYDQLVDELDVGDKLLLADGTVSMVVVESGPGVARLRVVQSGEIRGRQGINLPGAKIGLPALTDRDRDNAVWAAEHEVDFVSLSFVRSAVEVRELKELLRSHGSRASVIAKIEKPEALEQLEEIVEAADGVMVARGDLGVEIDVAQTPVAQKRIIDICHQLRKPVIVATEMLDSMQHRRRPTRAEASDVANAILDGTDACMLSGETAIGKFPREAVEMMNRIMLATEELLCDEPESFPLLPDADVHPITSAVVAAAADVADQIDARMVVVASRSGATARIKAKQRDFIPTIGVSGDAASLRMMCLYWGITPLPGVPLGQLDRLFEFVVQWGRGEGSLASGDRIVFVCGTDVVQGAHNVVEVREVP